MLFLELSAVAKVIISPLTAKMSHNFQLFGPHQPLAGTVIPYSLSGFERPLILLAVIMAQNIQSFLPKRTGDLSFASF